MSDARSEPAAAQRGLVLQLLAALCAVDGLVGLGLAAVSGGLWLEELEHEPSLRNGWFLEQSPIWVVAGALSGVALFACGLALTRRGRHVPTLVLLLAQVLLVIDLVACLLSLRVCSRYEGMGLHVIDELLRSVSLAVPPLLVSLAVLRPEVRQLLSEPQPASSGDQRGPAV